MGRQKMKEAAEFLAWVWRITPKDWRPAAVMMIVAVAMLYGYFTKIATPISEAHAAGVNNTAAIQQLDQRSEARHQQDQQRFQTLEGGQAKQGQQLRDIATQQNIILQVLLTGQRPQATPPPRRK